MVFIARCSMHIVFVTVSTHSSFHTGLLFRLARGGEATAFQFRVREARRRLAGKWNDEKRLDDLSRGCG